MHNEVIFFLLFFSVFSSVPNSLPQEMWSQGKNDKNLQKFILKDIKEKAMSHHIVLYLLMLSCITSPLFKILTLLYNKHDKVPGWNIMLQVESVHNTFYGMCAYTCRYWGRWSLGSLCSAKKILRMSKQVLNVPEYVYIGWTPRLGDCPVSKNKRPLDGAWFIPWFILLYALLPVHKKTAGKTERSWRLCRVIGKRKLYALCISRYIFHLGFHSWNLTRKHIVHTHTPMHTQFIWYPLLKWVLVATLPTHRKCQGCRAEEPC